MLTVGNPAWVAEFVSDIDEVPAGFVAGRALSQRETCETVRGCAGLANQTVNEFILGGIAVNADIPLKEVGVRSVAGLADRQG